MWFLSAVKGDFRFISRIMITLSVSMSGTIKIAIETTGALLIITQGMDERLMNLIAMNEIKKPTTMEPVSPIKILKSCDKLKYKNASNAPSSEIARKPIG